MFVKDIRVARQRFDLFKAIFYFLNITFYPPVRVILPVTLQGISATIVLKNELLNITATAIDKQAMFIMAANYIDTIKFGAHGLARIRVIPAFT